MNEEHGVNKNNLNLSWKLRLHGNSNLYIDHKWIPIAVLFIKIWEVIVNIIQVGFLLKIKRML